MKATRIAITLGDPAGIGPDVVLALARRSWPAELVVLGDRDVLAQRATSLGITVSLTDYEPGKATATTAGQLSVRQHSALRPVTTGRPDPANAESILQALDCAVDGCLSGEFDAMVTAPVSKAIIADAGTAFSGHTEYLAARCGRERVVMLLAAGELRVALATTHLPLSAVPAAITAASLRDTLRILDHDLRARLGIATPRLTVLGLNPHAGESGKLGREELDIIIPTLNALRDEGLQLVGPLPADTAFSEQRRKSTDAYLAMYHDQGLPVLKYAGFGQAVNITLGLPIIRTSVDHGTAFDIAGTGKADPGSLFSAIDAALEMATRRVA